MRQLLPLLFAALPGLALAGTPIELPPGEDEAAWVEALELGRELAPDLELGPAIGPGPSVRILPGDHGWVLDIRTASGHAGAVVLPPPTNPQGRLELVLVCADALAGSLPQPSSAESPDQPAPDTHAWAWGPALLGGTVDLLSSDPRYLGLLLEPISIRYRSLGVAPVVQLGRPMPLAQDLQLRTTRVSLDLRWQLGDRVGWRLGGGPGVELRGLTSAGGQPRRDWSAELGLASDVSVASPAGARAHAGLRFVAALPPTVIGWNNIDYPIPTYSLLVTIGLGSPWPSAPFQPVRSKRRHPAT